MFDWVSNAPLKYFLKFTGKHLCLSFSPLSFHVNFCEARISSEPQLSEHRISRTLYKNVPLIRVLRQKKNKEIQFSFRFPPEVPII